MMAFTTTYWGLMVIKINRMLARLNGGTPQK
jgi:hypothetical protein